MFQHNRIFYINGARTQNLNLFRFIKHLVVQRNMRYKIIISFIAIALAISLGFDIYFSSATVDRQKMINNIRSEIILEWANEMDVAAHYLKNASTNIDVADRYGMRWFLLAAYRIMNTGYQRLDDWEFYEAVMHAPLDVAENLIPYQEGAQGAPVIERHINATAIEMFGNLADKIWNVTQFIFNEAHTLGNPNGVNPTQRLEEKGILDDLIDGCFDISLYSYQIHEFNPKFQ